MCHLSGAHPRVTPVRQRADRPGQYATIKAALGAAQPFDIVEIGPGVWHESIIIDHESITLRGSGIDVTILDCELDFRAVRVEARNVAIEDLTIERGKANRGGGVHVRAGSCAIRDCVFRLCTTTLPYLTYPDVFVGARDGGAVCAEVGTALTLVGVSFENNRASSSGGAVACFGDALHVSQCLFSANFTRGDVPIHRGGAVFAETDDAEILDSDFYDNYLFEFVDTTISSVAYGGAISIVGQRARVEECSFEHNHTVRTRGAAVRILGPEPVVAWCTFTRNFADGIGGPTLHLDGANAHAHHCMFDRSSMEHAGSLGCSAEGGQLEWIDLYGDNECALEISGSTNVSDMLIDGFGSNYGGQAVWVQGSGGGVAQRLQIGGTGFSGAAQMLVLDTQYEIYDSQFIGCMLTGKTHYVIRSQGATVLLDGCTIAGATDVRLSPETETALSGRCFSLRGCILWNPLLDGELAVGTSADIAFSDVLGGAPGMGNVDVDPEFVNSTGPAPHDYRLLASSPLIDAGSPSVLGLRLDAQLGARRIDGDLDGVAIVDMGAFEFTSTHLVADTSATSLTLTGPPNSTGVIAVGDAAALFPFGEFGTLYFNVLGNVVISPLASLPLQITTPPLAAGSVAQGLALTPSGAGQVSNPLR